MEQKRKKKYWNIIKTFVCWYLGINKPINKHKYRESSKKPVCLIVVGKLSDILGKIIPLFDQYKLQGIKRLDGLRLYYNICLYYNINYLDFKRAAELLEKKVHFTKEGLEEIRKLKAGMNSGRKQGSDR